MTGECAVCFLMCVSIMCVCHLKDAGSSGHTLQYAGLVAVLEEDGSVVVDVLHLDKYSGRARPPAARWAVVCVQEHSHISKEHISCYHSG